MADRKRALDDPENWPLEALIERAQETIEAIFRRLDLMRREESRSFGLDPDETMHVARASFVASILSWSPKGGRNGKQFIKGLYRLRLSSHRKAEKAKGHVLSLDAPLAHGAHETLLEMVSETHSSDGYVSEADSRLQEHLNSLKLRAEIDPSELADMVQLSLFEADDSAA